MEPNNKNKAQFQIDPNLKAFFASFTARTNLTNPITWFSFVIVLVITGLFLDDAGFVDFPVDYEVVSILIFGTGIWYCFMAWEKIQVLAVVSGLISLLHCPLFYIDDFEIQFFLLFIAGIFFIVYWFLMTDFRSVLNAQKLPPEPPANDSKEMPPDP